MRILRLFLILTVGVIIPFVVWGGRFEAWFTGEAAVAWLQHANPFDSKKKKHGGNLYQQVWSAPKREAAAAPRGTLQRCNRYHVARSRTLFQRRHNAVATLLQRGCDADVTAAQVGGRGQALDDDDFDDDFFRASPADKVCLVGWLVVWLFFWFAVEPTDRSR